MSRAAEGPRALDGGRPASWAGQMAWLLYEVAQGPFFVAILIVIYAPFFSATLVGDPAAGQAAWGYVQGTAGFLVALTCPVLGAACDAAGPRKPALALSVLIGAIAMACLWYAVPGQASALLLSSALLIAAALAMEAASVYHNAFLPSVVEAQRVGRLSGLGYGLSYIGSIAVLVIWLALFDWPETPAFGLNPDQYEPERMIGIICALWTVAFALPLLLLTPDRARTGLSRMASFRTGWSNLKQTVRSLRHYRNVGIFLLARTIYYDGVLVTFSFMGVYAVGVFGWSIGTITAFSALALILSALGGMAGGFLDDRVGSKRTILFSVWIFALGLALNLGNTPSTLFYWPIGPDLQSAQLPLIGPALAAVGFERLPDQVFSVTALSFTALAGPALASSRTMLARIAPAGMATQFYGLFTLTGKATSFTAPFAIAVMTTATGSQRAGMMIILGYLIAGGLGMIIVREEQSTRAPGLHASDEPVPDGPPV